MNILQANLKHLYQRRSYLYLAIVFAIAAFAMIGEIVQAASRTKLGSFSVPVLWIFFIGSFVVNLPLEVLTKPFSYCLPGHRRIPRQFMFFIGLVLSFLWSLVFLFYPALNFIETVLACLSAFSLFTIFYWIGLWYASRTRNWIIVLAFLPLIMNSTERFNVGMAVVHAVVHSPVLMIMLGGIVNVLAWRYWGRPNLARQSCGILWLGTFAAWNKEKMAKYNQARQALKDKKNPDSIKIPSGLEDFFVSRVSAAKQGSFQQYVWGTLYRSLGVMASRTCREWMFSLMVILLMTCFLCYMPGGTSGLIFIMLGLMFSRMGVGVFSSLLISGGRQQRFWSALTVALATGLFVTVVVTILATLTHLLESIMPQLTVSGKEFTFTALNMKYLPVPFVMIPITLTINLILYKRSMLLALLVIFIFQFCFVMSIIGELIIMNSPIRIGQIQLMTILLCSWAVFIAILRRICSRYNLIGQGR